MKISDEKAPSRAFMVRYLRTSEIGWGRERYLSVLKKELAQLESELAFPSESQSQSQSEDGNLDTHKLQRRDNLQGLMRFFGIIFSSMPELDLEGCLPYGRLAGWLYDFVHGYAAVNNAPDGEAKKAICEELTIIKDSFSDLLEPEEAYTRLTAVISGLRVSVSNPKPGYLHIDHYSAGPWIARPHVFVIGLDANRFPGVSSEDPILLDEERQTIGHGLLLLGLRTKEKTYDLIQFLGLVPETLTVSYSAFDTTESRTVFPATVLLQLHRLLAGDETLDYHDLLSSLGWCWCLTPTYKLIV